MDDVDAVDEVVDGACLRRDNYLVINPDVPQWPEMSIAMTSDTDISEFSREGCFFDVPRAFL